MEITQISVTMSETVPKKRNQYANWKPEITMTASIDELIDNVEECRCELQLACQKIMDSTIKGLIANEQDEYRRRNRKKPVKS